MLRSLLDEGSADSSSTCVKSMSPSNEYVVLLLLVGVCNCYVEDDLAVSLGSNYRVESLRISFFPACDT